MAEDTKTTATAEAGAKPKTTRKAPAKKPVAKKAAVKAEAAENTAKKLAERAQEVSRKALLANLGFYGKAFDQVQEQFSALQEQIEERRGQASEIYAELVKRGEKVEADAREAFEGIEFPSLKELTDREALEAKMDKARARFDELKSSLRAKVSG